MVPVHPGLQPPSHCPVNLSHLLATIQFSLHLSKQFLPYWPEGQSAIYRNLSTNNDSFSPYWKKSRIDKQNCPILKLKQNESNP